MTQDNRTGTNKEDFSKLVLDGINSTIAALEVDNTIKVERLSELSSTSYHYNELRDSINRNKREIIRLTESKRKYR